jgi:ectoine hydroxylase-related dioxygenase (phytanoyl-CoA dioxygenase family)
VSSVRTAPVQTTAHLRSSDCRVADLAALVDQTATLADYPYAAEVVEQVLQYDAATLQQATGDAAGREAVETELIRALTDGPGVVVIRGAFADRSVVDRVSAAFDAIITAQRAGGGVIADHFAKAGANDRVWNALEKLAVQDPEAFVDYYANDILALVATAWLGPAYQMTSQVNVVRPGGVAQDPHRDYHLGFLSDDTAARYPAHVHALSPALTLQGAVAHTDMPVESGPTMYLPYSHQYPPGYLAWRRPDFRDFFLERYVQLPLRQGDAVFFNPALFHGAGSNVSTEVQRMANLVQVSSAFGRAMETVDRIRTTTAIYPVLRDRKAAGVATAALTNALCCAAEGYPFPTNLDRDPNVGGLTPLSQLDLVQRALDEDWPTTRLTAELDMYVRRHRSDD